MLKTILIDDEPLALARLKRLLDMHKQHIEIIAEAKNGQEGLELIEKHRPDVVFLDIEMPLLNGFEMLAKLNYMPKIVFATAFDQYAIRAFEENSVDYLLKPIEAERLQKTIEKLAKTPKNTASSNLDVLAMLEKLQPKKEIHSLSVKSGDKIMLLSLSEISHFVADEKYVFLHTTDGKQFITSYTITYLEEKLPETFLRISRSAIVNAVFIQELHKTFQGKYLVSMKDSKHSKLETGQAYTDNLMHFLKI